MQSAIVAVDIVAETRLADTAPGSSRGLGTSPHGELHIHESMGITMELQFGFSWKINGCCEGMPLFWWFVQNAFSTPFYEPTGNVLHLMDWWSTLPCLQPANPILMLLCIWGLQNIVIPGYLIMFLLGFTSKWWSTLAACSWHCLAQIILMLAYYSGLMTLFTMMKKFPTTESSILASLSVWLYPTCAETHHSFMLQLQAHQLTTKCWDHGTLGAARATKNQFGINNNSLI